MLSLEKSHDPYDGNNKPQDVTHANNKRHVFARMPIEQKQQQNVCGVQPTSELYRQSNRHGK
jgi:hypothetical protein